ncbi:hypothetical protein MRB53_039571 [Persea americana]|nr:hypothetical protein MRB53_039571 [Persea americana]
MDHSYNEHQRDWDRELKGNFEMAILEGQRRWPTNDPYPDEKAESIASASSEAEDEIVYPNPLQYGIVAELIRSSLLRFLILLSLSTLLMMLVVGSVICAAATSSLMLIVGRAVAGVGAAALFSGSMTILGYSVPIKTRAIYLGCLSSMFGIASVVGPILGGALTDKLSWRWCFWINLPFGLVSFLAIFAFFKNPKLKHSNLSIGQKFKEMDLVGSTFFIGAIVCLLLALQWGGITYPWSDGKVTGCLAGFAVLIVFFAAIQWRLGDSATMPPRVLCGNRTVFAGAIFTLLYAMAFYTHVYYLPFYFQIVKGSSAEQSGIQIVPYLISVTVGSIMTGAFITTLGLYNPPLWFGSALFTVGAGMIYTLQVDSPSSQWIGYQILAGFGIGCMVQIPFIAMQANLSVHDMPVGNAVAAFFNTFGGALALAIDQNVFQNTLKQAMADYASDIPAGVFALASQAQYRSFVPAQDLAEILFSYNYALSVVFVMPIAWRWLRCLFLYSSNGRM